MLFVIALLIFQSAAGQDYYYFVSFTDKDNSGFSINEPAQFLSQRAIERRQKQNLAVQDQDLPVSAMYVENIKNKGIEVFEQSRWFNGVIVKTTQAEADQLKNELYVESVEYIAPQNYAGRINRKNKFLHLDNAPSDSLFQNKILGVEEMHNDGYYGQNKLVAVLDGGFTGVNTATPFAHLFTNNQVLYTYDFVSKTSNVYSYSSHGTRVFSSMAAHKDGVYEGIAPDADYMLFVTENVSSEYRIEEYYWLIAAERADSTGADIITTSLGYNTFDDPLMNYTKEELNGTTAVITRAANIASEKGIVVVSSSGNEADDPWGTITFPSDMINGLSVGSITTNYDLSYFSSFGPTADGRIKPEVVAMGSGTILIGSTGSLTTSSGTSFAAPQVAALAAGVWQAYPGLTSLDLINALKMSADNASDPNNGLGYGIPSYQAVKNYLNASESNLAVDVFPNPVGNGQTLKVRVMDPEMNNKVTLKFFESTGKQLSENLIDVNWRENEANMVLDQLPVGIYFLKVLFDSGSEEFRIVKL